MKEPGDDGIDTGQPIAELRLLAEAPDHGLVERIRRRINRRLMSAEFLRYSWTTPFMVVLEYVKILLELFSPTAKGKERER